jgi:hypothetical protein
MWGEACCLLGALPEHFAEADGGVGKAGEGESLRLRMACDASVARRPRFAVDLDFVVHKVDDPVLGDPGGGVEEALVLAILPDGRVGHFDDEQRGYGVLPRVVAARYDSDVRLRLRIVGERERAMLADARPLSQDGDEICAETLDGVGMRGTLGVRRDESASQELDALVVEEPELDEALVLAPPQRADGLR